MQDAGAAVPRDDVANTRASREEPRASNPLEKARSSPATGSPLPVSPSWWRWPSSRPRTRMTEGAIDRAVADHEAASRFASELTVLRMMAMSSDSPVPARLYLGIEECFYKTVAVPFENEPAGRTLVTCAQMELGRLHAQGGRWPKRAARSSHRSVF